MSLGWIMKKLRAVTASVLALAGLYLALERLERYTHVSNLNNSNHRHLSAVFPRSHQSGYKPPPASIIPSIRIPFSLRPRSTHSNIKLWSEQTFLEEGERDPGTAPRSRETQRHSSSINGMIPPGSCHQEPGNMFTFASSSFYSIDDEKNSWLKWMSENYNIYHSSFRSANDRMKERGMPGFEARGVVTTVEKDSDVENLILFINILISVGSRLPVEVWTFSQALSQEVQDRVAELVDGDGRALVLRFSDDENNYFPISNGGKNEAQLAGLINSGFKEVLFLAVDTILVRNPDELFKSAEYKATGTVFWPDFQKVGSTNPVWRWMNQPCVDEWQLDGGIMLVDKSKSWEPLSLSWYLNRDEAIREWHNFVEPSDLYRFVWRATSNPFHFIQHWLAPVGSITKSFLSMGTKRFCGTAFMQHDAHGEMLAITRSGRVDKKTGKPSSDLRYVKRYRPYFNQFVPAWYIRSGLGSVKALKPHPHAIAPGSLHSFATSLGVTMETHHGFGAICYTVPEEGGPTSSGIVRYSEIVDLDVEVPLVFKYFYDGGEESSVDMMMSSLAFLGLVAVPVLVLVRLVLGRVRWGFSCGRGFSLLGTDDLSLRKRR
ncbi:hypothetical protein HDU97_002475 [Phlyctochytrium planicorne]|nr:hypothetical protein HDU97_002475 [Phlyctochytrium planicorne]